MFVAFVMEVSVRRIVGWRVSSHMRTDVVVDVLKQAWDARPPQQEARLIHHSDRGTPYVLLRYTERLAEAGLRRSVGRSGDSCDTALTETINGLGWYKTQLICKRGPWKTRESLELATLQWVHWFNHDRLLEPIGHIPPAGAEASCRNCAGRRLHFNKRASTDPCAMH
jgi:putative transposase